MSKVYIVRIRRADKPGVDSVRIRADSRADAESAVYEIYPGRVLELVRRKKDKGQ